MRFSQPGWNIYERLMYVIYGCSEHWVPFVQSKRNEEIFDIDGVSDVFALLFIVEK